MRELSFEGCHVHVGPDPAAVARAAARHFASLATTAAAGQGAFHVALSGGSTPKAMYRELAGPAGNGIPWGKVHVFFGDERPVAPEQIDSNYRMATEALLSHVPIPTHHIHRIEGEIGPPEAAARYEAAVRKIPPGPRGLPAFDLILLGLGADGHTASLFPETGALVERVRLVRENHVPKLRTHRITFTYPLINAAHEVAFLATGADKAPMARAAIHPSRLDPRVPARHVRPDAGRLVWFLDEAAATMLG
jgi:6-phosphogluconolactonase